MNKLAAGGRLPPKTQSSFLQKKLQQRVSLLVDSVKLLLLQKFFDSGDYAMNQDKEKKHQRQLFPKPAVGANLVTPNVAAQITKINEPEQSTGTAVFSPVSPDKTESDEEEHLQIPKPETVPKRKASILHPSVHSKLSPQPLFHHEHSDELSS